MTFGDVVRQHRKQRGWNQAELAKRVGISQSALSRWEAGEMVPDFAAAMRLARVLEVSPESLLGTAMEVEDEPPSSRQLGERLKQARVAAGFSSAMDAAEHFKWTYTTYAGHENGSRGIKLATAREYAGAFGCPIEWLLVGDEDHQPRQLTPSGVIELPVDIDPDLLQSWKVLDREKRAALVQIARVLAKRTL